MSSAQRHDVPTVEGGRLEQLPELPEGWVPKGMLFFAIGHRCDEERWEVILPHYSIAAQGGSIDEAFDELRELMEDYFRMCHARGLTFGQAWRPLPLGYRIRLGLLTLLGSLIRGIRFLFRPRDHDGSGSDTARLHFPLSHATG